jgi:hypothetical protein
MFFQSWLQELRSALLTRRAHRRHRRHSSKPASVRRPSFELLEDRSVPAFLAPVDYAVAGTLVGMQAGDFNGDGIPDLATAGSVRSVSVLLSNGDGTFQPAKSTSTT